MNERVKMMAIGFVVMVAGIFMFGFTTMGLFLLCVDEPITLGLAGWLGLLSIAEAGAIVLYSELVRLFKAWMRKMRDGA